MVNGWMAFLSKALYKVFAAHSALVHADTQNKALVWLVHCPRTLQSCGQEEVGVEPPTLWSVDDPMRVQVYLCESDSIDHNRLRAVCIILLILDKHTVSCWVVRHNSCCCIRIQSLSPISLLCFKSICLFVQAAANYCFRAGSDVRSPKMDFDIGAGVCGPFIINNWPNVTVL